MSLVSVVEEVDDVGSIRAFNMEERAFLRKYISQYRACSTADTKKKLISRVAAHFLKQFFPQIDGYERNTAKRVSCV